MKEFLKNIVSAITDNSDTVEIEEINENDFWVYIIKVPETEVGKIIGRGGKVINSIRCLARIKGARDGKKVIVKINDQIGNGFSLPTVTADSSEESSSK